MSRDEDVPTTAISAKRLAALLCEARSVQHRLDKLAAAAAGEDSTTLAQLAEARDAVERLVIAWRGRNGRSSGGPTRRGGSP